MSLELSCLRDLIRLHYQQTPKLPFYIVCIILFASRPSSKKLKVADAVSHSPFVLITTLQGRLV